MDRYRNRGRVCVGERREYADVVADFRDELLRAYSRDSMKPVWKTNISSFSCACSISWWPSMAVMKWAHFSAWFRLLRVSATPSSLYGLGSSDGDKSKPMMAL